MSGTTRHAEVVPDTMSLTVALSASTVLLCSDLGFLMTLWKFLWCSFDGAPEYLFKIQSSKSSFLVRRLHRT
jgi:hypothetical protein